MFVTVAKRKRSFALVVKRILTFKDPPQLPFELVAYILVLMANIKVTSAGGRGSQIECFETLCKAYPRYISENTFNTYGIWVPCHVCCSSCGYSYSGSYGVPWDWRSFYDDTAPLETLLTWRVEPRQEKNHRPRRFRPPRFKRRKNKDRLIRDAQ